LTLDQLVESLSILSLRHGNKEVLFHHHYGDEPDEHVTLQINDNVENVNVSFGTVNIILEERL